MLFRAARQCEVTDVKADHLLGRHAEEVLRSSVRLDNHTLGSEHGDHVRGVVEEGAVALLGAPGLGDGLGQPLVRGAKLLLVDQGVRQPLRVPRSLE